MDSAVSSLLGAFLLSIIGLLVFIWSLRKGLLVENPRAASAIFARGEIGHTDDPALTPTARRRFQAAATEPGDARHVPDAQEIADRIAADRSSAFPGFGTMAELRAATAQGDTVSLEDLFLLLTEPSDEGATAAEPGAMSAVRERVSGASGGAGQ